MEDSEEKGSIVYRLELSERDEDDLLTALTWYISELEAGSDMMRSRAERVCRLRDRIVYQL